MRGKQLGKCSGDSHQEQDDGGDDRRCSTEQRKDRHRRVDSRVADRHLQGIDPDRDVISDKLPQLGQLCQAVA